MNVQKILLIDDSPEVRMAARLFLSKVGGWAVALAGSGEEGLAMARADRPDLVVLDMSMPDMDGAQTLAAFKADPSLAAIPVLFLSGVVHDDDRYVRMGAVGAVLKGAAKDLPAAIRQIVGALP